MGEDLMTLWRGIGRIAPEYAPDGDPIDGPTGEWYLTGGITQHPEDAESDPPPVYWHAGDGDGEKAGGALCEVWNSIPALVEEVLRLRRILAVERGDAGAAPEGWERRGVRWNRRHPAHDFLRFEGPMVWRGDGCWLWQAYLDGPCGEAPTALEAMEAADAALAEVSRG